MNQELTLTVPVPFISNREMFQRNLLQLILTNEAFFGPNPTLVPMVRAIVDKSTVFEDLLFRHSVNLVFHKGPGLNYNGFDWSYQSVYNQYSQQPLGQFQQPFMSPVGFRLSAQTVHEMMNFLQQSLQSPGSQPFPRGGYASPLSQFMHDMSTWGSPFHAQSGNQSQDSRFAYHVMDRAQGADYTYQDSTQQRHTGFKEISFLLSKEDREGTKDISTLSALIRKAVPQSFSEQEMYHLVVGLEQTGLIKAFEGNVILGNTHKLVGIQIFGPGAWSIGWFDEESKYRQVAPPCPLGVLMEMSVTVTDTLCKEKGSVSAVFWDTLTDLLSEARNAINLGCLVTAELDHFLGKLSGSSIAFDTLTININPHNKTWSVCKPDGKPIMESNLYRPK